MTGTASASESKPSGLNRFASNVAMVCSLGLSCLLLMPLAQAAQDVTVIKDNSPVRQEPNKTSKIIDYLQNGEDLRVSSFPVNGEFYKIRAKNGQYGWVHMRYLSMEKPKEEEDADDGLPTPERDRKYVLRALGGFDFFRPQDLNDVFAFNELNYGYNVGGELGWAVGNRISLLFRSEALLKNVVARETTTGLIYNLSLRSYPLMLGIDFKFIKDGPIKFSISAYGGLAIRTSFVAETLNQDQPNTTTLMSTDLTTLITANVTRSLGRSFSAFASVGYRHLRSNTLETENTNNGGQVFRIGGVWVPRVIDLSGFLVNAGLGFHF